MDGTGEWMYDIHPVLTNRTEPKLAHRLNYYSSVAPRAFCTHGNATSRTPNSVACHVTLVPCTSSLLLRFPRRIEPNVAANSCVSSTFLAVLELLGSGILAHFFSRTGESFIHKVWNPPVCNVRSPTLEFGRQYWAQSYMYQVGSLARIIRCLSLFWLCLESFVSFD